MKILKLILIQLLLLLSSQVSLASGAGLIKSIAIIYQSTAAKAEICDLGGGLTGVCNMGADSESSDTSKPSKPEVETQNTNRTSTVPTNTIYPRPPAYSQKQLQDDAAQRQAQDAARQRVLDEARRKAEAEAKWKKIGEDLKKWLEETDVFQKGIESQASTKIGNTAPSTENSNFNLEARRDESMLNSIDANQNSSDQEASASGQNFNEQTFADLQPDFSQPDEGKLRNELSFWENCSQQGELGQDLCSKYGSLGWIVGAAEGITAALICLDNNNKPEKIEEYYRKINDNMNPNASLSISEKIADINYTIQNINVSKRALKLTEFGIMTARVGLSVSPLGNALDLCEAISGREFCLPSGRTLSKEERFFAMAGTAVIGGGAIAAVLGNDIRIAKFFKSVTKLGQKLNGVVEFKLAPRVLEQLNDSRLGSLAGKLDEAKLNQLLNSPNAQRFLDANSGHINIIQTVEDRLLRITVTRDEFKIISVGPIKANGITKGIENARFIPLK